MAAINERIKEMRLKSGFTLAKVAEAIGVKEATAQRYESGEIKNVKYEIILELSKLFGCDPVYLLGWELPKTPQTTANEENPIIKEIIRMLHKETYTDKQLLMISEMLKSWL